MRAPAVLSLVLFAGRIDAAMLSAGGQSFASASRRMLEGFAAHVPQRLLRLLCSAGAVTQLSCLARCRP
jgi:hypothetical protein